MRYTNCLCFILLWVTMTAQAGESSLELPLGSHPVALRIPYFPDRAHAVVFRNWRLVDPERIARTLETDAATVRNMARAMGLPAAGDGWRRMSRRGYITIVRRNWHLLPYEQLLALVGMTKDQLWFSLKEDDFLFHKLGSLKPRCERVVYAPPNDGAKKRLDAIRGTVRGHFEDLFALAEDPRFSFIERLGRRRSTETSGQPERKPERKPEARSELETQPPPGPEPRRPLETEREAAKPELKTKPGAEQEPDPTPGPGPRGIHRGLRFIYSYFGSYGDPLSDPSLDPYPDGLLERLAEQGVNGVWLHTVLRQLAPGGADFPEFGEGWERRLENLERLVARARQFGIGVYLYMNEPRAMPAPFFEKRRDMAGVREGDSIALCTSDTRVRRWLSNSLAHVFREVPHLAGVFTITASENLTSCASHFQRDGCRRCASRSEAEIIAEVNAAIASGVHRASPKARVIAWDWGWNKHGDAAETIALLPATVWLMSVSEWSLPIVRGGVKTVVGEYSMSSPGPGPRAQRHWELARKRGLRTAAKVQFNATWELSSVPWLPVLDLVAEHCARLSAAKVDGTMLSWTVGGYPSPNLQVAARFAADPRARADEVLEAIARERYGDAAAPLARRAWKAMSDAFREFPYHGAVVYNGPQQIGAANPLYFEPSGYRATMVGIPYDDIDRWRGPYPRQVFAAQFEKVARGWRRGLELLGRAATRVPEDKREVAQSDLRIARAAYVHFASVANQAHFVIARDSLLSPDTPRSDKAALRARLRSLAEDEIGLARQQFELSWTDARLGFEASNHYFYVPLDCVEKVLSCEYAMEQLDAQER